MNSRRMSLLKRIIRATGCTLIFLGLSTVMLRQMVRHWSVSDFQIEWLFYSLHDEGAFITEDGAYPLNLEPVAQSFYKVNPGTSLKEWNGLYYVSGLRTNDPPRTPMVIRSSRGLADGLVLHIGECELRYGRVCYLSDYDSEKRKFLLTEPWKLVRDEFEDVREYEAFTNRLKLIKITGLK